MLRNKFKGHHFNEIFLCGPEMMINSVSEVLQENNISEKCIHFELFSSTEEGEIEVSLEGSTSVTIILDDDETTFEMSKKSTILDAALEKDLDAPYSCQGGICSSCVARVVVRAEPAGGSPVEKSFTWGEVAAGGVGMTTVAYCAVTREGSTDGCLRDSS